MTVTYHVGDTREVIKGIPDGSVDLLATSPPFYQLRSYVPNDHDAKSVEIGSEPDPSTFLDTLLELTAEWGRVLAPHGSIAVELGDTYSGSGGAGGDYNDGGLRDGENKFLGSARAQRRSAGLKAGPKSLACIPDLYTIALAYGIHPLTGKESPAGKWLVRNKIVWHRPNPAVGALGDKVRPSTSYIVVATRSPKRWFDLTAVRGEAVVPKPSNRGMTEYERNGDLGKQRNGTVGMDANPAGAPPLDTWFDHYDGTHDTWTLTTQPSRISVKVPTRVPCGPDDGGERTTSPDCPVHGDQADPPATAPDGEPLGAPSSHTSRTDGHRDLGPQQSDACDAETSSCSHRTRSSATPCGKESSRTAPAPSTSQPGTPSAQTADGTARTSVLPESSGDHRDTSASSSDEVCPRADVPETAPRSDHTSDPESACSCTFHLDKYSVHSHYAMWPAKLAERLILMMCPREVCRVCGKPRRRVEKDRSAFDIQPRLAAHIKERREACGYTSADLNGWFGYKEIAKNWERTDKHGAAIPNADDWPVLKKRLGLSDEFDDVVMGERVWTVDPADYITGNGSRHDGLDRDVTKNIVNGFGGHSGKRDGATTRQGKTLGWTDCGCVCSTCNSKGVVLTPDAVGRAFFAVMDKGRGAGVEHLACPACTDTPRFRPGVTLDPFAGSGTTCAVADLHGRDAIGIDFNPANRDLYPARYDEVKKSLFGTPAPMPGQETFDFEVTA